MTLISCWLKKLWRSKGHENKFFANISRLIGRKSKEVIIKLFVVKSSTKIPFFIYLKLSDWLSAQSILFQSNLGWCRNLLRQVVHSCFRIKLAANCKINHFRSNALRKRELYCFLYMFVSILKTSIWYLGILWKIYLYYRGLGT